MSEMRERMVAGDWYRVDEGIAADLDRAARLQERFNAVSRSDGVEGRAVLVELLGSIGEDSVVRPPLFVDFGTNITIGRRTFVNNGATILDVGRVTIGDDVQIGPNVQLLTPVHPMDAAERRAGWEGQKPITIGDGVWLAGGVIVCAGATIGENTVVGAGAVVTRDLPADAFAAGNPARVIRRL